MIYIKLNFAKFGRMMLIAPLAVNFVLLSHLQNEKETIQYKRVFGSLFLLERNKYCSIFMINIKSSLIHSKKLKTNMYWFPVLAAFQFKCFQDLTIIYLMTYQNLFSTFKHNILLIQIVPNATFKDILPYFKIWSAKEVSITRGLGLYVTTIWELFI